MELYFIKNKLLRLQMLVPIIHFGEADNLRRAMGKKNFEIMNATKKNLLMEL